MGEILIIGGGAAGMAAAIAAASCGDKVLVLERMDRVGKKILATGNGRCNLMNVGELRYPGGGKLAASVLERFGAKEQMRFWQAQGLRLRQEDGGRVYPVSGQASSVLDTMRMSMHRLGVEVRTGVHVSQLRKERRGWTVLAGEERYRADRVIVAGGGCAQPKLGSDGSCYRLLTSLGHRMVPAAPALTQLLTDTDPIRGLSGIRVRCSVRIMNGAREKYRESGELLFADYGVTGVCVMQCARYAAPGDVIRIDLTKALGFDTPEKMAEELERRVSQWKGSVNAVELLTGLCVPRLASALLKTLSIPQLAEMPVTGRSREWIRPLVRNAAEFTLRIKGVKGFEQAQVTAGGIASDEFDPLTMESRIASGIHAAGEVIDVDGDCGGFNLMFAFGSGIIAGFNGRAAPW